MNEWERRDYANGGHMLYYELSGGADFPQVSQIKEVSIEFVISQRQVSLRFQVLFNKFVDTKFNFIFSCILYHWWTFTI